MADWAELTQWCGRLVVELGGSAAGSRYAGGSDEGGRGSLRASGPELSLGRVGRCPSEQCLSFAFVAGEVGGALVLGSCFRGAVEFGENVRPDGR